jgi:4-diphosphocytidyl-2-C-methyl-D-erythritol kinase
MFLVERAPAKINLGLHVLRRRPDGDHDVETVLHRIDWADTVTVEPAETLSMTCSDPALPTDETNLCLRAAHALKEAYDVDAGAELHLEKRVPYGAGLGGGSSDAAATLRLLTRLWGLDADPDRLHALAAALGADVPFFLLDAPAALATGRGDKLTVLEADGQPYRLPYPVLVVAPPIEVATPDAYAAVTPNDAGRPPLPDLVRRGDLGHWRERLVNDFEDPITAAHPAVAAARDWLRDQGADYVSLTGSGGAVYGVFGERAAAERAREAGRDRDERVHLTPVAPE